jgi:hypothetical protein
MVSGSSYAVTLVVLIVAEVKVSLALIDAGMEELERVGKSTNLQGETVGGGGLVAEVGSAEESGDAVAPRSASFVYCRIRFASSGC